MQSKLKFIYQKVFLFYLPSFNCLSIQIQIHSPLTMIQTTFIDISKVKKKPKKHQTSANQLLIRSLGRQTNKQNRSSNKTHSKNTSFKQSIQLTKSTFINTIHKSKRHFHKSLDRGQFSKINIINNSIPLFENVKILKNSRLEDDCHNNRPNSSKQYRPSSLNQTYQKNIELSQKLKSKQINQTATIQKSSKFTQKNTENIQQKLEAYVQFVNQLFDEVTKQINFQNSNPISRKKCLLSTLGHQILRDFNKKNDTGLIKTISKSIQVSNFCSFPSKVINRQLDKSLYLKEKPEQNEFKKIIGQLSQQNSKLTQLITQNQRKNIKMFIQMSQNESKQIQKCKKYLSTLYDKYKILQKSIIKENDKFRQVCQKNSQLQKINRDLQKKNNQLYAELERIKSILEPNQSLAKLSIEEEPQCNTIFDFTLNDKKSIQRSQVNKFNMQVNQTLNIERSFVTKRQKASSCLSTHLNKQIKGKQEDLMSCTTINKTKNMKKKKNKSTNAINLKNNFIQNVSDSANCFLKKEILTLRTKLNENNQIGQSLQNRLDGLQQRIKRKDEKIERMQTIINQQISQIQNLMKINSNLSNEIRITQRQLAKMGIRQEKQGEINKIIQKRENIQIIQKLTQLQKNLPIMNNKKGQRIMGEDEYRIIAMQAQILQKFINSP